MKTINLRQLYPHINSDFILEVSDEIALAFHDFDRCEHAYQMRRSRNKAYYSLDRDAGVEKDALLVAAGPDSIYESKFTRLELNAAISKLPQAGDADLRALHSWHEQVCHSPSGRGVGKLCS